MGRLQFILGNPKPDEGSIDAAKTKLEDSCKTYVHQNAKLRCFVPTQRREDGRTTSGISPGARPGQSRPRVMLLVTGGRHNGTSADIRIDKKPGLGCGLRHIVDVIHRCLHFKSRRHKSQGQDLS